MHYGDYMREENISVVTTLYYVIPINASKIIVVRSGEKLSPERPYQNILSTDRVGI